jgi:hypothetical protein
MSDTPRLTETSLAGLGRDDWLNAVAGVIGPHGGLESLGPDHNAALVRAGDTLLVTFESIQGIAALSDTAHPLGWELAEAWGWSHLALISDGDTWFRDRAVYGYFDRLVDDGFFEEFDRVIYYGAGPCGYAAAAFSVAAPGARVLAVQPQATLDARLTEWDDRFVHMRRTSFSDRYGYAPDMLDAADHAFILYDPYEALDAMHATLFEAPNVTRLRLRNMGGAFGYTLIACLSTLKGLGKLKLNNTRLAQCIAPPNTGAVLRSTHGQATRTIQFKVRTGKIIAQALQLGVSLVRVTKRFTINNAILPSNQHTT